MWVVLSCKRRVVLLADSRLTTALCYLCRMQKLQPIEGDHYPFLTRLSRTLATFVSYIFHPLFMPVVLMLLLYKLAPVHFAGMPQGNAFQKGSFFNLLVIVGVCTVLFPLLTILLMKALGFLKDIEMRDSKDRIMPLMGIMIFYFWAYHVVSNLPGTPLILKVLLLGSFWNIIAVFMINIFFKISMHAVAAGGTIGLVLALMIQNPINMLPVFYLFLFLAAIIGVARLLLGAHRQGEVWFGYIVGLIVMFGAYLYI